MTEENLVEEAMKMAQEIADGQEKVRKAQRRLRGLMDRMSKAEVWAYQNCLWDLLVSQTE